MIGCPSPDDWFALGTNAELDRHLDQCEECRAVAAMIGRAGVLGDAPTASGDDVGLVPELVAPGTTLGRFVVRGAIGAGGMGVVLEAFDPKLERTVALKVVRRMRDDAGWERARERVLAEAKAMARLSHPNVVAIHDLIEIDDERLIAMEYVAGPDLEAWLAQAPPQPQRISVRLDPATFTFKRLPDADGRRVYELGGKHGELDLKGKFTVDSDGAPHDIEATVKWGTFSTKRVE